MALTHLSHKSSNHYSPSSNDFIDFIRLDPFSKSINIFMPKRLSSSG